MCLWVSIPFMRGIVGYLSVFNEIKILKRSLDGFNTFREVFIPFSCYLEIVEK